MHLPWTISKIEALDKFSSQLVWTNFVANVQTVKKYKYGWTTSCPKLPQLKALARYKYIINGVRMSFKLYVLSFTLKRNYLFLQPAIIQSHCSKYWFNF